MATVAAEGNGARAEAPPAAPARRLRCPHCHDLIQLADGNADEVLCPGCGSAFRVPEARQTTTAGPMRRLGKFQLLDRVGVGAFGAVWRARDTELDRVVALKIPHAGSLAEDTERKRFDREARAAAQLRHPGIVTVHEVQQLDGLPAIVSDFIDGVSLKDFLEVRRLTFREAAQLVAQVAEAVDYAHGMGLVHRDLKPANILLEQGQPLAPGGSGAGGGAAGVGRPLVMDFGLALRGEAEVTLTLDGHILGTPAYMSPEQAAGRSHEADPRSDVYSLGVILYELLTGELPFRGSRMMILHQVLHEEARPPRKLNDKVPRDLETVCLKAMAKEPARRYPTARALADDLGRFLAGEPVRARPVAGWVRAWRWARRRPAAAALLIAIPVALMALAGLTIGLLYNAELAGARQDEEGQRRRAEAALKDSRTYLYYLRIAAAEREWLDNNVGRAKELLAECPAERRQWEWHYLDRLCHPELPVLSGHTGVVWSAAFSPDGSLVASAGDDGTVRLWDAHTGNERLVLRGQTSGVFAVTFSPDGKLLAAAGGNPGQRGPVRLWRLDRPGGSDKVAARPLRTLPGLVGDRCQVAFSPNGKLLAVASGFVIGKPFVKLFAVAGLRELRTQFCSGEGVVSIAFSPKGRLLVTAGGRNNITGTKTPGLLQVWDVASGKEVHRVAADPNPNTQAGVAFSPGGRLIALSCQGERVILLDAGTFREVRQLRADVNRLAFSPDGKQLATAGNDGAVRIWDPATGDPVYTLRGHSAAVMNVAYSARGDRVVSTGMDHTVRLWDPSRGQEAQNFRHHAGGVTSVAFGSDRWLVSGGFDRTVQVWEPFTARPPRVLGKHQELVWSVAVSPDGTQVASGGGDWQKKDQPGEVKVWSRATGEEMLRLRAHAGVVWCVTYSPDGSRLATAGGEYHSPGEVKVWDARTGQPLLTIPQPQGVRHTAFSPDGRRLAGSIPTAGAVKVWDAATGRELFRKPADYSYCVAFSPDGRLLAAGTRGRTVLVWDLATGRERTLSGHHDDIIGLAFSPDGRRLASAGADAVVKLWDVPTGQEVLTLHGHTGNVFSVAFSPDGRRLASASDDGTVKVWDARPRGE